MILHVCFVLFLVPLISTERSLTLLNPRDGIINRWNINPRFAHRISKRSTDVSAAQQQALLNAHNEARSEVSPSATNMKIMKWDDSLATSSQTWADGCSFAHSTSGENLAIQISTGSLAEDVYDISEMVKSDNADDINWVNEKFFYTYSDTNCPSNDVCGTCQAGEQCGHYTQVVWANSEFVGCGVSYGCTSTQLGVTDPRFTNANTVYLVCQYSPSGNFIGQAPYEQGAPCSDCPSTPFVCTYNNTLCTDSSPTSCDSAPIVENAEVTGTGVSIGDTRSYTCDSGFTLNGASEISCGDDGTWSAAPTCVEDTSPTSCDSAPIVENAQVTGTGVSIGDTRSYTCDSGFTLNGASEISCGADGTWSAVPTCVEDNTPTSCDSAPIVENAEVTGTGVSIGDTRRYTCDSGFTLNGASEISCGADGTWSAAPTCVEDSSPTSCDSAPIVENAEVTGTGVSIGDTRSYTCDSGFTLNGASEISCGADGTWSAAPTCVEDSSPTSCDSAPIVENAEVTGTGVSIGDTRSYTCDSGFTLNGASEISCGTDGTWSAAPTCVEDSSPTSCDSAPIVENAEVTGTGVSIGDTRSYTCDSGFTLNGASEISCGADGTWSAAPTCVEDSSPTSCDSAPIVENAEVTGTGVSIGDTRSYTCDSGFTLNGASEISCGADGTWSAAPTCVEDSSPTSCDSAPIVENAEVTGTGVSIGDTRSYTCDSGFTLNGASEISCGADGTWSEAPTCVEDSSPTSCDSAPIVENAEVTGTGVSIGDTRSYTCDSGFTLNGASEISCGADGTWSAAPTCVEDSSPTSCDSAPIVENAEVTGTGVSIGDTRSYTCDSGFTLNGASEISCGADGTWSAAPTCVEDSSPTSCDSAPIVENAEVTGTGVSIGDTRSYTCDSGFTLNGASEISCGADGTWSAAPTCVEDSSPTSCDSAPIVENAEVTGTGVSIGDTRSYTCDSGFTLNGAPEISCGDDGTWSAAPTCVEDSSPTSCDSAPIVENAEVTGTGVLIGDTRNYTCDSGFTLNGASEISCGADGTWSAAPTCVEDSAPTSCDSAPIVANADVTGTGVSIGDTRSYTCDSGFTLNGVSEISCEADGTWSAAPTCVEDSTAVQATMACSFEADDDMCSMGVCDGFSVSFTDHIDADSAYPEVCHEGENCKVIALSSIRRRNMKGCLVSDYLPDGAKCVTLAYYMHGDGYGSLDVFGRADEGTFYILSVTEDLGDQWQTIIVDVPPGTNERIFVRVKRFSRRNRNTMMVAVDDIEVLEGTCPCSRIPCANGGTCNANGNCQCVDGYTGSRCEQEVTCGNAPAVTNAVPTGTGQSFGDTVDYECNTGFTLNGESQVECHANGAWSTAPTCDAVTCGPAPTVTNAVATGSGESYGDMRAYTCNTGFRLNGTSSVECQANEEWTTAPTCDEVTCGTIPTVANAVPSGTGDSVGDTRDYTCSTGYILNGASQISCLDNGAWSTAPTCVEGCGINPCVNGGTCGADFICDCVTGFAGNQCELIDSAVTCGFETDFCELIQTNDDDANWLRLSDATPSYFTGPSEAAEGSTYAYIEASEMSVGDIATLETSDEFASGDRCIRLQLHMRGYWDHMGLFKIFAGNNGAWELAYVDAGHQGSEWYNVEVTWNLERKKVRLCAIRGYGWMSDIAIDDFEISPGAC